MELNSSIEQLPTPELNEDLYPIWHTRMYHLSWNGFAESVKYGTIKVPELLNSDYSKHF